MKSTNTFTLICFLFNVNIIIARTCHFLQFLCANWAEDWKAAAGLFGDQLCRKLTTCFPLYLCKEEDKECIKLRTGERNLSRLPHGYALSLDPMPIVHAAIRPVGLIVCSACCQR